MSHLPILLSAATLALLLSACSLTRVPTQPGPVRATASKPAAPAAVSPEMQAATARLLLQARALLGEAKQQYRNWSELRELDALMSDAESAARRGSHRRAQQLADEVLRRSDLALDAHYLVLADIELQKVQTYTGLSDAQLGQIRTAELAIERKQSRKAYQILTLLSRELAETTQRYVVAAGDSLWIISGKPEIYGNPWLWPLIWDANRDTLPDPGHVRAGQKLKIKANPTIEEVVQALDRSRSQAGGARVRIGEVREAHR
jgi:nucleoid-associated protein YgaU